MVYIYTYNNLWLLIWWHPFVDNIVIIIIMYTSITRLEEHSARHSGHACLILPHSYRKFSTIYSTIDSVSHVGWTILINHYRSNTIYIYIFVRDLLHIVLPSNGRISLLCMNIVHVTASNGTDNLVKNCFKVLVYSVNKMVILSF